MSGQIDVMESVYGLNDRIADETKARLTAAGVFAVNVIGAPGCGKTSLISALAERLAKRGIGCAVIEGDIEGDIDTKKLRELGVQAVQLNTGGACHLEANAVAGAVGRLGMGGGVLFIENIGNLVCPAEFVIGEHVKLLLCTAADGSDKPYKYPLAFERADCVVVNKRDLLPYVDFDADFFSEGVRRLNRAAPVLTVSCRDGGGVDELEKWLVERMGETIKQ